MRAFALNGVPAARELNVVVKENVKCGDALGIYMVARLCERDGTVLGMVAVPIVDDDDARSVGIRTRRADVLVTRDARSTALVLQFDLPPKCGYMTATQEYELRHIPKAGALIGLEFKEGHRLRVGLS